MSTLLIRNADLLVTMDDADRRIPDGGLLARDGFIERIGPTAELPDQADQVLNARGMIVLPGLVNTHHHLYQTLTRAVPAAQDATLFQWLKALYPIWAGGRTGAGRSAPRPASLPGGCAGGRRRRGPAPPPRASGRE